MLHSVKEEIEKIFLTAMCEQIDGSEASFRQNNSTDNNILKLSLRL